MRRLADVFNLAFTPLMPPRLLSPEVRARKQQRLDRLLEQQAIYGIDTSPEVVNEIQELELELEIVDVINKPPIDPNVRALIARTDYAELFGKFIGDHARRLTAIENWQTKRDAKVEKDDEQRDIRQHRLDLVLGALIVVTAVNIGFNIIILVHLLSR